jgi:hypothetical protein
MSSPHLEIPGNYTIVSIALITLDTKATTFKSLQPLWSKPIQITVLPEKTPEFQTVLAVFILCIVSAIIFVRIKIFNSK